MYGNPAMWHALLDRLAGISAAFLRAQVDAGAAAVQLFDSWVGVLSPDDYRSAVRPHSRRVFDAMAGLGVPRIHFGVGTGELLRQLGEAGGRRGGGGRGGGGRAGTRRGGGGAAPAPAPPPP